MWDKLRKGFVSFVVIGAACGSMVTHHATVAPGHIVTSSGRIVHLDAHGCYRLRASETDLGMALRYCPREISR